MSPPHHLLLPLLATAMLHGPALAAEESAEEAAREAEAHPGEGAEAVEVVDVEEVEEVTPTPAAPTPATEGGGSEAQTEAAPGTGPTAGPSTPSALDYFGRLHPALVHLPIGFLLLVLLLDLLAFVAGREALAPCGLAGLALAVASAIPAIATGLIREEALPGDAETRALVETHEALMFAVLALALVVRWLKRDDFGGAARWAYLGLMLIAAALVGAGGHWGGKLVFGESYLPF